MIDLIEFVPSAHPVPSALVEDSGSNYERYRALKHSRRLHVTTQEVFLAMENCPTDMPQWIEKKIK